MLRIGKVKVLKNLTPEEEAKLKNENTNNLRKMLIYLPLVFLVYLIFLFFYDETTVNSDFINSYLTIIGLPFLFMFTWYLVMKFTNKFKYSFILGFFSGFLVIGITLLIMYNIFK
ncbi:MAG: hypothetical protein QM490_01020 [Candidatus Gracilibacteria bacterium]